MHKISGVMIVLLGGVLLAGCAAPKATADKDKTATTDTADSGKLICRKMGHSLNTRLGERTLCFTKAQWKVFAEKHRDELWRLQNNTQMPASQLNSN